MSMIFGHEGAAQAFQAAMQEARLHHAWLLAGPMGIGKASLAHSLATKMLSQAAEKAGTAFDASALIQAGSHPDFKVLERLVRDEKTGELARSITVDQVRWLIASMVTAPTYSNRRVVIIDAVDDLERNAANALLKTLEEPPSGTVFLLISHAPGRLLPTIRSRCRLLRMGQLDDANMDAALVNARPDLDAEQRKSLSLLADGSPGKALVLADQEMDRIDVALEQIAASGDPTNTLRIALSKSFAGKSAQQRYEAFLARLPQFLADKARRAEAHNLGTCLGAWENASALARNAVHASLDPQTVAFSLLGQVAALAPTQGAAKA